MQAGRQTLNAIPSAPAVFGGGEDLDSTVWDNVDRLLINTP